MTHAEHTFHLTIAEKQNLTETVKTFIYEQASEKRSALVSRLIEQLKAFSELHNGNRLALGVWVYELLQLLIPHIHNLKQSHNQSNVDFVSFWMHLPFDEDSKEYKATLNSIAADDVAPLTPERYIHLMQISVLLIELGSENSTPYLEELQQIMAPGAKLSGHMVYIMMLVAHSLQISGKYLEEQITWLDLISKAWYLLDSNTIVYFLVRWVVSLNWIRPSTMRKELLVLLNETERHSNSFNQAIILFELFNLPDKTITTGEKLIYLNKLSNMPTTYFTVDQLQNKYYFSGNIKSSIESSFLESVTDFQYSNYYIHKRWSWIRGVNHLFMNIFSPQDYLSIQTKIELKIVDLINMINIQSNAFVETLQSNFSKIEDLYHQVEDLSLRDTLTGLYNRRYLYNNINELLLLAARHQSALSFVMIDIDDFKPINDTYGHLAGDYILTELSTMLKSHFRKSDFIVRYGGEEFLIVLFESDNIQSGQTLEILRSTLDNRVFEYQNHNLHVTISIGISSCMFESPFAVINLEKLISEADSALYESKHNGKNRITSKLISD
jgi:diguanylate cyclase (GGDEF)-like protein